MPIVDWGYFLRYLQELNEGGAMNNEPKAVKATRKDMAEQALKHYNEISTEAMHHNSLIPQAIRAWEREPKHLQLINEMIILLELYLPRLKAAKELYRED